MSLSISLITRGYIYPLGPLTAGFVAPTIVSPVENILLPSAPEAPPVQTVAAPIVPSNTQALGIHPSDVIIRSCLMTAIADIRANPWLLDYCFASLGQDALTAKLYGAKEKDRAKEWFLATDVPVTMDYRAVEAAEGNLISISLVDSVEAEVTLGDVHYEPTEQTEATWTPLTKAFSPVAYSPTTGIMKLPASVTAGLDVAPGMVLGTRTGARFSILSVLDNQTITLQPGLVSDFKDSVILSSLPRLVSNLESASYRESYRVNCHAHGEPAHLMWLHSIVMFILLRYKEVLLEARGFERSTISNSPFSRDESFGREQSWVRSIQVTGYVRHYWPKAFSEQILSSRTKINYSPVGQVPVTFIVEPGFTEEDALWMASDGIGTSL